LAYRDKGPWYPWALKLYGFGHRVEAFGRRNTVERGFSILKASTRRFSNNFRYKSTFRSTEKWVPSCTSLYNIELGLS